MYGSYKEAIADNMILIDTLSVPGQVVGKGELLASMQGMEALFRGKTPEEILKTSEGLAAAIVFLKISNRFFESNQTQKSGHSREAKLYKDFKNAFNKMYPNNKITKFGGALDLEELYALEGIIYQSSRKAEEKSKQDREAEAATRRAADEKKKAEDAIENIKRYVESKLGFLEVHLHDASDRNKKELEYLINYFIEHKDLVMGVINQKYANDPLKKRNLIFALNLYARDRKLEEMEKNPSTRRYALEMK